MKKGFGCCDNRFARNSALFRLVESGFRASFGENTAVLEGILGFDYREKQTFCGNFTRVFGELESGFRLAFGKNPAAFAEKLASFSSRIALNLRAFCAILVDG